MILRTTRCRWRRIFRVLEEVEDYELKLEFVEAAGGEADRCRVTISDIPYSAVIRARDLMMEHCYRDGRVMRRGLSSSEHGALQDLVKATNEEARHPALREVGMVGHVGRVFHAWNVGPKLWSPAPIEGGRWGVLKPYHHVNEEFPSEKFTLWSTEGYAPPSRLDDEALHWRFVDGHS